MRTDGTRRGDRLSALALVMAAALVAHSAFGYGEQGYYTGAYALVGEGGCTGEAMGVNPAGGCTPGVDALIHSEAFATGVRGDANHSGAIADLPLAGLRARSIFPDGAGNQMTGEANLTDTFTVIGDLPADATVTVAMRMGSIVTNGAGGSGYGLVGARLYTDSPLGSGTAYFYRDPTCAGAGGQPCSTAEGWIGNEVVRTVTVNDANRSFRVDALLSANGTGNPGAHAADAWCKIAILVPDGLTLSTASEVFPVPEPPPSALALSRVATLAASSRRRRRR
jgi:hypothetical protein